MCNEPLTAYKFLFDDISSDHFHFECTNEVEQNKTENSNKAEKINETENANKTKKINEIDKINGNVEKKIC